MSLYFVFTVDGDWDEYFEAKLPLPKRQPKKKELLKLIDREIELLKIINGKVVHFVHTSPLLRDFFLRPEFIAKWQQIQKNGGSVAVHCHEEDLYRAWYCDQPERMEKAIVSELEGLRSANLSVVSYRGGFLAFSSQIIPILEKHQLYLDFSCDPGRHLFYNNVLVSDWRRAPNNFYRLSYDDHRQVGNSQVWEIPLGIYVEKQSLWSIWRQARRLKKKKILTIISVLAHTYDFTSIKMRLKLKIALAILKRYGRFINDKESLNLISQQTHKAKEE